MSHCSSGMIVLLTRVGASVLLACTEGAIVVDDDTQVLHEDASARHEAGPSGQGSRDIGAEPTPHDEGDALARPPALDASTEEGDARSPGEGLWHFELSADEPAEAHAALLVDGMPFFEERIPIPQVGGLISRQVRAARAIPAGTPIYFHLHNHGANSWSLVEVSVGQ